MTIQFALQDLIVFLLCALGITVAILIIPVILNIIKVTGIVRSSLEKNQESIQMMCEELPDILDNIKQVSYNGREITNQLKISLPMIAEEVEGVTYAINSTVASYRDTPEYNTEDATGFIVYVPLIKEVLQIINSIFSSKK